MTHVTCNCVYNKSERCKHVSALIYFINNEESLTKTDFEQVWGKPSTRQFAKEKYSKGNYFSNMWPPAPRRNLENIPLELQELEEPSSIRNALLAETKGEEEYAIEDFLLQVQRNGEINSKQNDCKECLVTFHLYNEDYEIYQGSYKLSTILVNYYKNNISLTESEIITLCCETLGQSNCEKWFSQRLIRISSSKDVHDIKSRNTKSVEKLVSDMLYPKKIDTPATKYGNKNESKAKALYKQMYNVEIKDVGLIVKYKQPWLCGSPDGVVIEGLCSSPDEELIEGSPDEEVIEGGLIKKIVEIKCPMTCEKVPIVNYVSKVCNVSYLLFVDGEVRLRESHVYYTQCQVQMYLTGLSQCDLFIYSPVENGSCCVSIFRNEDFIQAVILLAENFFFTHYLPSLLEKTLKQTSKQIRSTKQNKNECLVTPRAFTGKNIGNSLGNKLSNFPFVPEQ